MTNRLPLMILIHDSEVGLEVKANGENPGQ